MKIIIVGGGEVGKGLANRFVIEDHEVTLIEENETRVAEIESGLDVFCVQGNGACMHVLEEAGVNSADILIAVCDSDECNMIACCLAKAHGVATTVARVRNEGYVMADRDIYCQAMNIDLIINPDEVAAAEVHELLQTSVATEINEFAEGKMRLVGLNLTHSSPMLNRRLLEIGELGLHGKLTVVSVLRHNDLIIPSGDLRLHLNDHVSLMVRVDDIELVNQFAGIEEQPLNKVVIMGGSRAGAYLANRLENENVRVVLIEADEERAARLADDLEDSLVLCADGTDITVLAEAGVSQAEGFVTASTDDENNILSALLGKQQGARKVIAILRKSHYMPLLQHIQPIDAALNPRLATINAILRYIKQGKIQTVASLGENKAEAMEVIVAPDSPVIGKALRRNILPANVVLGGIIRDGDIVVPQGDTTLQPGDRALVVAPRELIGEINHLLSRAGITTRLRRFLTGKKQAGESEAAK